MLWDNTWHAVAESVLQMNLASMMARAKELGVGLKRNLRYAKAKTFGQDLLEPEYRRIYSLMRSDALQSQQPSKFWKKIFRDMEKELFCTGLRDFKKRMWNSYFSNKSSNKGMFKSAMWQYYNHVKNKDKLNLLDTIIEPSLGNPELFEIDGHKLTMDLLQSIDEFYAITSFAKVKLNDSIVVCEVGGGYGRLAHVFLQAMPNSRYILVDLPQSLIVAYYYLSQLCQKEIYPYGISRTFKTIDRSTVLGKRITFLLPHQLEQVAKGTIDIYPNTYSFQEMTPDIVRGYFTSFSRIGGRAIYLKNRVVEHNKSDGISFALSDYPLAVGMKVIKTQASQLYPDMAEQFISFS